jgi:hypothetical protein
VAGSCGHGNELSGSINEFIDMPKTFKTNGIQQSSPLLYARERQGFHKRRAISWLPEELLLNPEERHCRSQIFRNVTKFY